MLRAPRCGDNDNNASAQQRDAQKALREGHGAPLAEPGDARDNVPPPPEQPSIFRAVIVVVVLAALFATASRLDATPVDYVDSAYSAGDGTGA